jgi:RNA 2',3'-cyclic 3'-phosphodiesterase
MPTDPEVFRLFIAVPAPPAVRTAAAAAADRLRGTGDVRWVSPDRVHLTLRFLGDTPAGQVPALLEALEKSANRFSRFVVELGDVGAFPNGRKPQTLWLGVRGEAERLVRLAAEVDRALGELGIPPEGRAFRPHLTIGRVRSPRGLAELAARLQEEGRRGSSVEWPVTEIHLVRSVLQPAGPLYTPLGRFPLAGEE